LSDLNEDWIQEDTLKDKYLTFLIGNESYGMEVGHVTEIVGMQSITEMPELPYYIKGIINLRGKIIPVMDVRLRFGKQAKPYDDRTCIIVINVDDMAFGLIVDTVSEVITIPEQDIIAPPSMGASNRYIKNLGIAVDGVKLLLDCEKLLTADEINNLASII